MQPAQRKRGGAGKLYFNYRSYAHVFLFCGSAYRFKFDARTIHASLATSTTPKSRTLETFQS